MSFSILEQVLVVDRHRQRASGKQGFSTPYLCTAKVIPSSVPLVVTNARGGFVGTRPSKDGDARYGFSLLSEEGDPDVLVLALYRDVRGLSTQGNWGNRCSSVLVAMERLRKSGLEPKSLILSSALLKEVCGEKAASVKGGFVTTLEGGLQVFVAALPDGAALVLPSPEKLGFYTRVRDYVGVMIRRADQTIMVVGRDLA